MEWIPDTEQILIGTEHKTLEDAVAADLVSAIPIVGALSDFIRLLDADTRPRKALQTLDLLAEPIPILNIVTPTNTLIYLDKKGLLPMKLEELEAFLPPKANGVRKR